MDALDGDVDAPDLTDGDRVDQIRIRDRAGAQASVETFFNACRQTRRRWGDGEGAGRVEGENKAVRTTVFSDNRLQNDGWALCVGQPTCRERRDLVKLLVRLLEDGFELWHLRELCLARDAVTHLGARVLFGLHVEDARCGRIREVTRGRD